MLRKAMDAETARIGLTPTQTVRLFRNGVVAGAADWDGDFKTLAAAFERSTSDGLFALRRRSKENDAQTLPFYLSPETRFWIGFVEEFLRGLCQTPEESFSKTPERFLSEILSDKNLDDLAGSAPFMIGSEFLTSSLLTRFGIALADRVLVETGQNAAELDRFLTRCAPDWHGVGTVWFHLAENKKDPERPFCFMATFTCDVSASGRIQHKPLGRALVDYAGAKNRTAFHKILRPIETAKEESPLLNEMVAGGDIYTPIFWDIPRTSAFLRETPIFERHGIKIRLTDWWKKQLRPKVRVTVGEKGKGDGISALLDFHVDVALDGKPLSAAEIRTILNADGGLVSLRGEWVATDGVKLREALDHWKKIAAESRGGVNFFDGMRLLAGAPRDFRSPDETVDADWVDIRRGQFLRERLESTRIVSPTVRRRELAHFKATLRPYQEKGFDWLRFGSRLRLGLCLADDMGLGKTVQLIALLLAIKNNPEGGSDGKRKTKTKSPPSLLILPASLLANWKSELERFAPNLSALFLHRSMTESGPTPPAARKKSTGGATPLSDVDLVVTTYGTLTRREDILQTEWNLAILDEGQAIKNPDTQQTKRVKRLLARSRIVLTGTPVENRLTDLWSIFDFLNPGYLGTQKAFLAWSRSLSETDSDAGRTTNYQPLRKLVAPFILRRLKTDKSIISDLPDKTEMTVYAPLSKSQAALYAGLVEELRRLLQTADGIRRRGLVLSYLMKFKQVCNHPAHYRGVPDYDPAQSGKFRRLAELGGEIAERQEKTLVFTQFREMTEPLNDFLATIFHRRGLVLHGQTAVKNRQRLVTSFQSDDGPPYFILSLKAGGTGLNLTAASHVIHFDRWWNPAVENQATDRVFRIGQTKSVLVHKFVCRGTIEERIDAMINDKRALSDGIIAAGTEKTLTEMSDAELIRFVEFDGRAASEE